MPFKEAAQAGAVQAPGMRKSVPAFFLFRAVITKDKAFCLNFRAPVF
jgi:hypothetical protein